MEDKLLFTDDNFELVPAEGEIWPGATVAITVIFRPTEPKQYHQVSKEEILVVLMKPYIVMLIYDFLRILHMCAADFTTVFLGLSQLASCPLKIWSGFLACQ